MPPKQSKKKAPKAQKTAKTLTPTPSTSTTPTNLPLPRIRLNIKANSQQIGFTDEHEDNDYFSTSSSSDKDIPISLASKHASTPETTKAYIITVKLRGFLDLEEAFLKEYRLDILDVFQKSYADFKDIIEHQID
jgi:hypothetical protein